MLPSPLLYLLRVWESAVPISCVTIEQFGKISYSHTLGADASSRDSGIFCSHVSFHQYREQWCRSMAGHRSTRRSPSGIRGFYLPYEKDRGSGVARASVKADVRQKLLTKGLDRGSIGPFF